jgi:hypothetical protein
MFGRFPLQCALPGYGDDHRAPDPRRVQEPARRVRAIHGVFRSLLVAFARSATRSGPSTSRPRRGSRLRSDPSLTGHPVGATARHSTPALVAARQGQMGVEIALRCEVPSGWAAGKSQWEVSPAGDINFASSVQRPADIGDSHRLPPTQDWASGADRRADPTDRPDRTCRPADQRSAPPTGRDQCRHRGSCATRKEGGTCAAHAARHGRAHPA